MGCHFLLQEIIPIQVLSHHLLCLLHCTWILYLLSHRRSLERVHTMPNIQFAVSIPIKCGKQDHHETCSSNPRKVIFPGLSTQCYQNPQQKPNKGDQVVLVGKIRRLRRHRIYRDHLHGITQARRITSPFLLFRIHGL